jgi:hypothetical protein
MSKDKGRELAHLKRRSGPHHDRRTRRLRDRGAVRRQAIREHS